jgi:type I restriction enzyme S subunit
MIKELPMEKQSLTSNWEYGTLGDAVNKGSSNISLNKVKEDNGEYQLYSAKGYNKNISFFHQEKEYLAIIKDGAGIGRVSKHPAKSSVVATMQYLIPKEGFDIGFVQYFLNGIDFESHRQGSTIPHVYFKDYKSEPFPLLPLTQQRQIVTTIDKAFAAIDTAKANTEQNSQNAKELFESYLQNVFENKGDDWEEKTLGKVTSKIGSGATPRGGKASYKEEGISLIRSMNVHDFYFKKKNLAFIDDKQADALSNVTLQEKDVLLNITGASIARCCMIPKEYLPARVNQHVSIIRAKKDIINPVFLASLLTSKYFKDQILEIGKQGATRQAITKVQLENFYISYPKEIEEQEKVVQNINLIKAETKKLEAIYTQKVADLEEMKKSVLQKAFSGQLKTLN